MTAAKFITIEGGEGAGKSTQATLLRDWLETQSVSALVTREPGGSPNAESIRELLLGGVVRPFGPDAEALFFAVARRDHLQATILPALETGTWVICDRFMDSTRAYQGAEGVSDARLANLETIAVDGNQPDLTFILDLPVAQVKTRLTSRGEQSDRFEDVDAETLARRRDRFLQIAAAEPKRCVLIDAAQDIEEIQETIRRTVLERFGAAFAGNIRD